MPQSKKITLTGSLTINGKPDTESNHRQAFVQQEDVFYSELTVREVGTHTHTSKGIHKRGLDTMLHILIQLLARPHEHELTEVV